MTSSICLRIDWGVMLVLDIIGILDLPASVRLSQRLGHGFRDRIGVENGFSGHVPRARPNVWMRESRAQKTLLVGIQDGHKRNFGKVQPSRSRLMRSGRRTCPFSVAQDIDPLEGFDIRMEIADAETEFVIVLVNLRPSSCQRRHQSSLVPFRPPHDLALRSST